MNNYDIMFKEINLIKELFKQKFDKELEFDCEIDIQQDGCCYISMKSKFKI
ncbi:MAG: hypothetical protein L6V95_10630 [Candidatus Melainabacteria bacterium]|nr:MAG: hypothetical protein L6V95_10630 [Candidatus Melainabacteria bacterium]